MWWVVSAASAELSIVDPATPVTAIRAEVPQTARIRLLISMVCPFEIGEAGSLPRVPHVPPARPPRPTLGRTSGFLRHPRGRLAGLPRAIGRRAAPACRDD